MEPEVKAASSSSSGLEFHLHPLVLINISDHFTRTKVNGPDQNAPARVVGCLLGQQSGRSVDIRNSFEVDKQVFPDLDVVGWYATGSSLGPIEMDIQRKIMDLNESPVFLLLDSTPRNGLSDLPAALYESELHVVDGNPSFIFVQSTFQVATSEAERIGVDQVAKLLPSGNAAGTDQLTSHLNGLHSATSMLTTRVESILSVLAAMQQGAIPFDPAVARQCAAIAARLPAADTSDEFAKKRAVESCDAMLSVLLAGVTTGSAQASALADKHNLAYERVGTAAKRGGKLGLGSMGPPML